MSAALPVRFFLALTLATLAGTAFAAADQPSKDSAPQTVTWTATFSPDDFSFERQAGYDAIRLPDGTVLSKPGWPTLPARMLYVALPAGMRATAVRVLDSASTALEGDYLPVPGQPPQPISVPGPHPLMDPDPSAYASGQPYPSDQVELIRQFDFGGQAIAQVRAHPLRYVASQRRLILSTSIDLALEGTGGYVCGDYLPLAANASERQRCHQAIAELVVNPGDVVLRTGSGGLRGVGPGDFDYVIVTQGAWVPNFQPLADWKTKKGVPATIVTTDWIYNSGGYSGSNVDKIQAFVEDAHSTWGATYFLLGGDTDSIPCHYRTISAGEYTESIPNDTHYADYDNDWFSEVYVSRAAVRFTSAITTFVDKVLTYEKSPPLTNYGKTAFFCGFDLHQLGSGEGEGCKIAIDSLYLPGNWTYRSEYDSEPGSHKGDVIAYLNQGNNLVNHADHSSTNSMGAGYTNHGQSLYNGDMSALVNGDYQSILYSLGCWACDFPATTCIGEAFVQNTTGGGVAFVGNSRYGWYSPFSDDGLSSRYDRYFFRSLFSQQNYHLGVCFADHKNDAFEGDAYSCWIYTELTLLGDPELPIWTDDPANLAVSHAATLYLNDYTTFPVQVTQGGGPVNGATVCLWKDGDVYERAQTNTSGTATFWFAPTIAGTMFVTVTARDALPYEGNALVIPAGYGTLTAHVAGEGSVTLNPPGGSYPPGTSVQVTAIAAGGWTFDHWEGDLQGASNPDAIVVYGDKVVTAVFEPDCNSNGLPDADEIVGGLVQDCNDNSVPDACEVDGRHGLAGTYCDDLGFAGLVCGRIDDTVAFDWGDGAPWHGYAADTFSIRWSCYVRTPGAAGNYTFYTRTDDGVRLWVAGQLIIDQWINQTATEHSGTVTLDANSDYPILMEYYDDGGPAVAELRWQPPGQAKVIIPAANLLPSLDCNTNGLPDPCDLVAQVDETSPVLSPIGDGHPQTYLLGAPRIALSDVLLAFETVGDFNWTSEHVEVYLNGALVGIVFDDNALACPAQPDQDQLVVPAADFNTAAGSGSVVIQMVATANVDPYECSPSTWITVRVTYDADPISLDANGNGIPDECEASPQWCLGDANCSTGAPDFLDIEYFVAALTSEPAWVAYYEAHNGGTAPPCPYSVSDLNGGGVEFTDIEPFVQHLGQPCDPHQP